MKTSDLKLTQPTPDMEEAVMDYRREFIEAGETTVNGSCGLYKFTDYREYLKNIDRYRSIDDGERVPSETYFSVTDGRVIGSLQLRRKLSECLLTHGGNIGYSVRPSERGRGAGRRQLSLALDRCREVGMERVLVTCAVGNAASAGTILSCGGVFEDERPDDEEKLVRRYWIDALPVVSPVGVGELSECLGVIHAAFATVAEDLGLTEENCPGHTSFMKLEKLESRFDGGERMFSLRRNGRMIGFFSLAGGENTFELRSLAVLPDCRHRGYGRRLLGCAKSVVRESGGGRLTVGIVEENAVLREWYAAAGFVHTGMRRFERLPFTVGFMEWVI